jgi:hypothetical protein
MSEGLWGYPTAGIALPCRCAADPQQSLPEQRLWEYAGRFGPVLQPRDVMHVVSEQEAASLFAQHATGAAPSRARGSTGGGGSGGSDPAGAGGEPSGKGGGGTRERGLREGLVPVAAAGGAAPAAAGGWKFRTLDIAVGLYPFLLSNWWHSSDGEWPAGQGALAVAAVGGRCSRARSGWQAQDDWNQQRRQHASAGRG